MNIVLIPFASAIIGALVGTFSTWWFFRYKTAMVLLSKALDIQALKEAYIVDGRGYDGVKLFENKQLLTEVNPEIPHLLNVEVRAALDNADWISLQDQYYKFLDGRRTWIVRDPLLVQSTLGSDSFLPTHPALLSSRAFEELEGWIEQVTRAHSAFLLPDRYLLMLRPLLIAVCEQDRRKVFKIRNNLTDDAYKFLEWYAEHEKKSTA